MTKEGSVTDSLVRFLSACCETDWRSELSSELFKRAYQDYCLAEGKVPLDDYELHRRLSSLGYVRTKRNAGWTWGGVRFIADGSVDAGTSMEVSSIAS